MAIYTPYTLSLSRLYCNCSKTTANIHGHWGAHTLHMLPFHYYICALSSLSSLSVFIFYLNMTVCVLCSNDCDFRSKWTHQMMACDSVFGKIKMLHICIKSREALKDATGLPFTQLLKFRLQKVYFNYCQMLTIWKDMPTYIDITLITFIQNMKT